MADEIDVETVLASQKRHIQLITDMEVFMTPSPVTEQYSEFHWCVRLELLESYWDSFKENDLLLQKPSANLQERSYFKANAFQTVVQKYCNLKAFFFSKLQPSSSSSRNIIPPDPQPRTLHTSLEAIKLPKFNGSQKDWETFKEQFSAMVIDDTGMAPVLKFSRLRNCLEGEALRPIQGIKVVGTNFEAAWEALCSKYDNKPLRFMLQMQALQNMPSANRESAEHLNSLVSTAAESINNFTALGREVEQWDDILNFFIVSKLSERTRLDWTKHIDTEKLGDFPTHQALIAFLNKRIRSLELIQSKSDSTFSKGQGGNVHETTKTKGQSSLGKTARTAVYHAEKTNNKFKRIIKCYFCQEDHFLAYCGKFLQLAVPERKSFVAANQLCPNCLNQHSLDACISKGRCVICGQKHHSKIHETNPGSTGSQSTGSPRHTSGQSSTSSVHVSTVQNVDKPSDIGGQFFKRRGFLATAVLTFYSPTGQWMTARALLDSGAEDSFFSEHMVQTLSLARQKTSIVCCGVGEKATSVAHSCCSAYLYSPLLLDSKLEVKALVLRKVAGNTPSKTISTSTWNHLRGLKLADPAFNVPGRVDCILGAEVFAAILRHRIQKGLPDQPAALETVFGWVVFGAETPASSTRQRATRVLHSVTTDTSELSQTLSKFWELEEVPSTNPMSPAEQACYQHFKDTHSRNADGRFVVRLPFKEPPILPDSKVLAEAFLNRLLRRLSKDSKTAAAYSAFIQEYADLNHMEVIPSNELTNEHSCYIPHHGVFKRDTNKIRVVFNASQKYTNGRSLNSFLHVGPKLQEDILIIILRWLFFPIVFSSDVIKMFRQFSVHPLDREWQRIVWRSSLNDPVQAYRLNTVTYGEGCAPFQANACMLQLADDGEAKYPKAAALLRDGRYADDFYAGDDSIKDLCETRDQLIQLLSSAGMKADKWASNRPEILPLISSQETSVTINLSQEPEVVSALGLRWLPSEDAFFFKISPVDVAPRDISKRHLLSEISRLFDPLGFLSPVVTQGKILLQSLWLLQLGWDEPVPAEIQDAWIMFRNQLYDLELIKIPRWLGTFSNSSWDLHCFCDASKCAYATVLYAVVQDGKALHSRILVSKSKVAPIKTISIPKLELCGAALLAKLSKYVLSKLTARPSRIFCWSDSKVVLAWLQAPPSRWKTFVANRVSSITSSLPPGTTWGYVPTSENPADLPTRGITPLELRDSLLWWQGPRWLSNHLSSWPSSLGQLSTIEERAPTQSRILLSQESELMHQIKKFSSIDKLIRVFAYIHRWRANAKNPRGTRYGGELLASELSGALSLLVKFVQKTNWDSEVQCLMRGNKINVRSSILRLSPMLDSTGLMRVGGRLQNSFLTFDEKHPIILPTHNHVTELLVEQAHERTLHGGPTVVQSHLSRRFWLVRGRNYIRSIIHRCVRCARYGGAIIQQQMAPLPAVRTRPARPFTFTGVDYAGPFFVRCSPGRGQKAYKAYAAIFVCMVVRAVHIEIVSDLSTAAFLAAFRRFIARRGLPHTMYSDNGTNFKGADEELAKMFNETSSFNKEVAASIAKDGIMWSFIPPRAPHFGGLWESNVRSFKKHLYRVIGSNTLTYEEFSTIAASIEACLNSRPLSPLSSNAEDFAALTPGHFLIGSALTSPAEPFETTNEETSARSRWHLLALMKNHFWKRWQNEFLSQMQQRSKWLYPDHRFQVGDLVLYRDSQLPPSKWPLARIVRFCDGPDGLHRVAVIKSAQKEFIRALNKLIRLPINDEALASSAPLGDSMVGGIKSC